MNPIQFLTSKFTPYTDGSRFPQAEADALMAETYRRGDRTMAIAVFVHSLLALLFASVHGTWLVSAAVGSAAAALFYVCVWRMPGRFVTRCAAGLALQIFT